MNYLAICILPSHPLTRNSKRGMSYLKAFVSIIKGIARYRLIRINNKDYLVDLEENPRFFFFPFIMWTHIFTLYELQGDHSKKVFEYQSKKGPIGYDAMPIVYPLVVGISFVLGQSFVRAGFANIPFVNHQVIQILCIILIIIATFLWRIREHKRTYEKMSNLITFTNSNRLYVKFFPINKMNYVFQAIIWLVFIGMTILSIGLIIQENLFIGLLGFWVFISFLPLVYRLFIFPKYIYHCVFYE